MKTFAALLLLLFSPLQLQADVDLDLVAYYTFDASDGADGSGNSLDLSLFGGIGFEPGLLGSALAPNGNNNKFAARNSDDEVLDFGQNDFTVQAWVKYNNLAGEQILVEKFSGTSGPGWALTKLSDNGFAFATDVGGIPVVRSAPQELMVGTWYNVTIRRTSGFFELFFNNRIIMSVNSAQGASSANPLLVGRRNSADGRDFSLEGAIDEIAIWSRALDDQEIRKLYNGGNGRPVRILFGDGFELRPEEE